MLTSTACHLTEPQRTVEATLAQASDRIRQQNEATYLRRAAAACRPRPRVSQAASTDSARTLGAACGVDLEIVLHLAHLHAGVDPGPLGSVVGRSPKVSERWSEVALDIELLGMRPS
jgi:hypothetical protein